jgi:hypothetical protein
MAATAKNAPRKTGPKREASRCRWYQGSYGSPKTADCANSKAPKRQLCPEHELQWKVIARKRAASRKTSTAEAAKVAALPKDRKSAPHPARVAHPRVAAMVAVEPEVNRVD